MPAAHHSLLVTPACFANMMGLVAISTAAGTGSALDYCGSHGLLLAVSFACVRG